MGTIRKSIYIIGVSTAFLFTSCGGTKVTKKSERQSNARVSADGKEISFNIFGSEAEIDKTTEIIFSQHSLMVNGDCTDLSGTPYTLEPLLLDTTNQNALSDQVVMQRDMLDDVRSIQGQCVLSLSVDSELAATDIDSLILQQVPTYSGTFGYKREVSLLWATNMTDIPAPGSAVSFEFQPQFGYNLENELIIDASFENVEIPVSTSNTVAGDEVTGEEEAGEEAAGEEEAGEEEAGEEEASGEEEAAADEEEEEEEEGSSEA